VIRGVAFKNWRATACVAAVGSALLAALIHHHVARLRSEVLAQLADRERDLTRQVAERSGFEQADLDALRARVGKFRIQLGPVDSWERLARQFGKAWMAENGTRDDRDGYSVQDGTFQLQSPATTDWPEIVSAVKAAEDLPGVRIIGFEMRTSGDHERRSVDIVKVVVAIQTLRSAAASAFP
jgi:hypothetical protein